jgi:hypothetical protein
MRIVLCILLIVGSPIFVLADEFFVSKIEPILRDRCYECHSHQNKMRGGLTLDSKAGWEQGGDSGPAVVVGRPDASLIIQAVRWDDSGLDMPPSGKLPSEEIALLEQWVAQGAVDPRVLESQRPSPTDWWSLKPLILPPVPNVSAPENINHHTEVPVHPIDAFVYARLHERKLQPSPEADRRTLIRRLFVDLHGFPPSPIEMEAFVNDLDPKAYEKLVDRLLDSKHYGERWARHWLDTIHFAETHGCGHDLPRDHAWRFRDYVIDALNADTLWPRFIREQLAADHFYPEQSDLIPALGFLGAGLFDHSAYETAPNNFDYLDRDDIVTQTMGAFASTTANCARCHAHKFDPITQEDYYSLQSVFAGTIEGNVAFDQDREVAKERRRWESLIVAVAKSDKETLLATDNTMLVDAWVKQYADAVKWTALNAETFTSVHGATLARDGSLIVSSGARPDKDT